MKTIKERWTELIEKYNGSFLHYSSVWDVHHTCIGQRKNSNVYSDVKQLFAENKKVKTIWAKIGAHAWSQHQKSDVLLFDVTNVDMSEAGLDYTGTLFYRENFV